MPAVLFAAARIRFWAKAKHLGELALCFVCAGWVHYLRVWNRERLMKRPLNQVAMVHSCNLWLVRITRQRSEG